MSPEEERVVIYRENAAPADAEAPRVGRTPVRLGWSSRILGGGLLAVFPGIFTVILIECEPRERLAALAFWAGAIALAFFAGYTFMRPRFWVDASGIQPMSLVYRKLPFVPWASVRSLGYVPERGFVVGSAAGRALFLTTAMLGLDAFSYFALMHAPPEAIASRAVRAMLEARSRMLRDAMPPALVPELGEPAEKARARIIDNPFYVLGVAPEAARADVERTGQKLLGLLGIGAASARTYATPFGPSERTTDKVRAALAELRVPEKRVAYELEARAHQEDAPAEDPTRGWTGAMRAAGWRGP